MRKIVLIVISTATFLFATSVYAQNVTREEFAGLLYPIISGCDSAGTEIADIENPSDEILSAVSLGVIKLSDSREFSPESHVTRFEVAESLVKAWEIRFGGILATALGTEFSGYDNLSEYEKIIINKADMLGIWKSKTTQDSLIEMREAEEMTKHIKDDMAVLMRYGMANSSSSFMDSDGIVGTAKSGRVYFYQSFNSQCEYDNAVLVLTLYDGGKLLDVSSKSYLSLSQNEFVILHSDITVPADAGEYSVKAILLDDFGTMTPLCEYRFIR